MSDGNTPDDGGERDEKGLTEHWGPPERADPGMRGTYASNDYSPAAQRTRSGMREDQHFTARPGPGDGGAYPFGEGGYPAGGEGQSGYGGDFNQTEASDRHLHRPTESEVRKAERSADQAVEFSSKDTPGAD